GPWPRTGEDLPAASRASGTSPLAARHQGRARRLRRARLHPARRARAFHAHPQPHALRTSHIMSEAAPITESASAAERRAGFLSAAGAYVIWGFLPLYLKLLAEVDVREVLGQRILWAAPSALIAVFLMSGWRPGWREIGAAISPRMIVTLAVSACFIFVDWGAYVYLVLHERVIEASLAYFLAPLVAVAVGVIFYRERISQSQVIALVLAFFGIVVQGIALGAPPWMAL